MPDNFPGQTYRFRPVEELWAGGTEVEEDEEPDFSDGDEVGPLETLSKALNGDFGPSQQAIARTGLDLILLLLEKNRSYGDSARQPLACFAKGIDTRTRMAVRMDDKISRLMRGDNTTFNEDAAKDLAGYLILFLSLDY